MRLNQMADIIATPFFFALAVYFYGIEDKTPFEYVLFAFAI